MASVHLEAIVAVDLHVAWAALANVGRADKLFAPVLNGCTLEGDTRTVTFANGMAVREQIIDIDAAAHRVAYAVQGASATHMHAGMQLHHAGTGLTRFVWLSEFLPADARPNIEALMRQGVMALRANLERAKGS
jgi:hypothetical protein